MGFKKTKEGMLWRTSENARREWVPYWPIVREHRGSILLQRWNRAKQRLLQ